MIKELFNKFKDRKCKTTVIIVGMHRSGTSCLAGSLEQHGLYLGEVFKENPHNRIGNRENARIMDLNNRILVENQGSWDNPPNILKWNQEFKKERDEIIKDFENCEYHIWGFKDPRTLITLPFWLDGISSYKLVGAFRNPEGVARSLNARNQMTREKVFDLWRIYNENLLKIYNKKPFPLISFDVTKGEYLLRINKIVKELNLTKNNVQPKEIFFEESLRSFSDNVFEKDNFTNIKLLYDKLTYLYENQFKKE